MNRKQHDAVSAPTARKPLFRALEQRLMFDAAVVDTAAQVAETTQAQLPTAETTQDDALLDNLAALTPPADRDVKGVVVIDQGVDNFEALLTQVPEGYATLVVPAGESGLEFIANSLQSYSNLESIHILSHGSDGLFQLGGDKVTAQNVDQFHDQLSRIGQSLNPDGDLLLYGCNLSASSEGQELLNALSNLSGADIAASDDLTGSSELGGDWTLETQVGSIEAATLQAEYDQLLTGATYVTTSAPGELDVYHNASDPIEFTINVDQAPQSGQTATLTISAHDIDEEQGEVDEVYLNGQLLGTLKGVNDGWSTTSFEITDLSLIKQGANQIEVRIDTGGDATEWIAQVDWGQILIGGGAAEHGTTGTPALSASSVSGDTATLTSQVSVNISTSGNYRLESVLTDKSSGNMVDTRTVNFSGNAGDNLTQTIQNSYSISTSQTGVSVMTFNLFYIDNNVPVLQKQTSYEFDNIQNSGPSIAPTSADSSITLTGSQDYTFSINDFSFNDVDGGTFNSVVIESLPQNGTLLMHGQTVVINQSIPVAEFSNSSLVYRPASSISESTSFTFKVSDGSKQSESHTFNLVRQTTQYIEPLPESINISSTPYASIALNGTSTFVVLTPKTPVDGATYSFTLVDGTGNADNSKFRIENNELHVANGVHLNSGDFSIRLQINSSEPSGYPQDQVMTFRVVDDVAPTIQVNGVVNGPNMSQSDREKESLGYGGVSEGTAAGSEVGITVSAYNESQGVTYALKDSASGMFAIDSGSGVVTYAANAPFNYEGSSTGATASITVTATDSAGNSSERTFKIALNNTSPTIVDDSAQTFKGATTPVTGNILSNDSDPASDPTQDLKVIGFKGSSGQESVSEEGTKVAGSNGGVFTIFRNGNWSFDPSENSHYYDSLSANGSINTQLQLYVTDGGGSGIFYQPNSILTVTVHGSGDQIPQQQLSNNEIGQSSQDGATVGTLTVTGPVTSSDYSFSFVSGNGDTHNDNFTISSNGELKVRAPSLMGAGVYHVRILATSSSDSTKNVEKTYQITMVDDVKPVISGDNDSRNDENGASGLASTGADTNSLVGITVAVNNNETVTFSLTDDAGGRFQIDPNSGVVSVKDGSLLDEANANQHTITVRATDSAGNQSDTRDFTITVRTIEVSAKDDTATTREEHTQTGNIFNNDTDPSGYKNNLIVTAVDGKASGVGTSIAGDNGGLFTINNNGSWAFDPNGDFEALAAGSSKETSVEVTVLNTEGQTSTSHLTMTVQGSNDAPTAITLSNTTYNTSDSDGIIGMLEYEDVDVGDIITFSIKVDPAQAFTVDGTTLKVKPESSLANGEHTIVVRALDTSFGEHLQQFTITINDNQAPQFSGNGDSDSTGDSETAQGVINEGADNDSNVGITVNATDNGPLTYNLTDDAGGRFKITNSGVIQVANGSLLHKSDSAFHDITVKVTDSGDNSSTKTYRITVTDQPPIPADDTGTASESAIDPVTGQLFTNDANPGEELSQLRIHAVGGDTNAVGQAVDGSNGGSFTISSNGTWSFIPDGDFEALADQKRATTSIEVTVADSTGATATSTLTITVVGANDSPEQIKLSGNSISLDDSDIAVGILQAIDVDSVDTHIFQLVSVEGKTDSNAAFRINHNQLELADKTLAPGNHTVHVQASDSRGATWVQSFTITVSATAQLRIVGDSNAVGNSSNGTYHGAVRDGSPTAGSEVGITVNAENTDDENAVITYALEDSADGRFQIDANSGVVTVAEGATFDRSQSIHHSILVSATSGGQTVSTSFLISVLADSVIVQNDRADSAENPETPITGNVLTNDPSHTQSGGPLKVTAVNDSADNLGTVVAGDNGGKFTVNADGSWTFDPDNSFEQLTNNQRLETKVTLTLENAVGFTTTSTLTVAVIGQYDDPTSIELDNNIYTTTGSTRVVGNLTGTDPDTDNGILRFSLPDNANTNNALFEIAGSQLWAKSGADIQPQQTYKVLIEVTDGQGTFSREFEIRTRDGETPLITGDSDSTGDNTEKNAVATIDEGYYENAKPVGLTVTTDHGSPVTFSINDNKELNPHAQERFEIDPNSGVVSVKAGTYINAEFYSYQDIEVKVTDGEGDSSTYTFRILVNNLAPTANADWGGVSSDATTPATGNLTYNDVDPGSKKYDGDLKVKTVAGSADNLDKSIDGSDGGSFKIKADGSWEFLPGDDFGDLKPGETKNTSITVEMQDNPKEGEAFTAETTLTVIVTAPAELALSKDNLDLAQADLEVGTLSVAGFSDGTEPYTYTLVSGDGDTHNAMFSISGETLNVTKQDPLQDPGEYSIRVKLTDSAETPKTVETVLKITLINTDLPLDLGDIDSAGNHEQFAGSVNEGAQEGAETGIKVAPAQARPGMTYSLTNDAEGRFTIDASTGVIKVAANTTLNAESGDTSFTVTVEASEHDTGKTESKSFDIRVLNVAFTPEDDTGTTTENAAQPINGNVFTNDTDAGKSNPTDDVNLLRVGTDGVLGETVKGSNGGLFTVSANGDWTFDPNGEFEALANGESKTTEVTVVFQEQGLTPAGAEITSKIIVTVEGENDAPTLSGEGKTTFTVAKGQPINIALDPAVVSDVDDSHTHANRSYSIASGGDTPPPSWLTLNGDKLQGAAPEVGSFTVEIIAADPAQAEVRYTLTLEVEEATVTVPTENKPDGRPDNPAGDKVHLPPQDPGAGRDNATPADPQNDPAGDGDLTERTPVLPRTNLDVPADSPRSQTGNDNAANNNAGNNGNNGNNGVGRAAFEPTATGNDSPEVYRDAERTLMPDGQFVEVMPDNRNVRDYTLRIGMGVEDQVGFVELGFRYELSGAAFVFTTSGGETFTGDLKYSARQLDGSELPDWIQFNRREAVFTGTPGITAERTIQVRVTAEAADGQRASAVFEIRVLDQQQSENGDDTTAAIQADGQPAPQGQAQQVAADGQESGKASLSEQIEQHAARTTATAEQQLLDQLAQIAFEQPSAS